MQFHELLEKRAGLGRYQFELLVALMLVDLNDGIQLVFVSLTSLVPELQRIFIGLTTSFYLGCFCGSILSGLVSDRLGRRPVLILGSCLQFVTSCLFILSQDTLLLLGTRFLYGLTYGATVVLTTSILSETLPVAIRGKGLLMLNFAVSIGKVAGVFCAVMTQTGESFDWRKAYFVGSVPALVLGVYFYFRLD
jgi:putative MFS transporter